MPRPRKPRKDELILITWEDAVSDPAWLYQEKAETYPLDIVNSVGFFLNQDKKAIRISGSLSGKVRDILVIPCGWVKSITFLKVIK